MALPGDKSPASIAVRVIETHKPPNRDKVAPPGEEKELELLNMPNVVAQTYVRGRGEGELFS